MTVTYREYENQKIAFAKKHNRKAECKVYTSPMENNRYHKEYCWSDGHQWCEVIELVTETVEAEAHGINFNVEVELYRTEFWSTEDSRSKYLYERA